MSQLAVEQGKNVTPGGEGSGLIIDPGFASQFGDQMRRNKIANLAKEIQFGGSWTFVFIHPLPCGRENQNIQLFFSIPMG